MRPISPRQNPAKAKRALVRGADGRLRPAGDDTEIGDVWEQQRRIKLNQAITEQRRRAALQRLRQEHGLVGLAMLRAKRFLRRAKTNLFGASAAKAPPVSQTPAIHKPAQVDAKNIEITVALPSLSSSRLARRLRRASGRLRSGHTSILRQNRRLASVAVVAVAVIAGTGFAVWSRTPSANDQLPQADVQGAASNKPAALQKGTPPYDTLLPAGKTVEALGGWTRISPPDRNPVYAYVDAIGSVSISVSQQPLPADFGKDTSRKVKELASSYGADQSFTAGNTAVYIGTSVKGPQSVIFSRDKILVLIKSVAPIDNSQWVTYINSLQ